ncbi:MAG TPA: DUF6079 family protein, partial [Halanaerobiales bacterium]|nr:DUF6079 family protein [Halanaerobiales bacterium]
MASLQEAIEKTGEITQDVFRKIKDRFPVHFNLTGTHIREIVSRRLIRLKSGAREHLLDIYRHYTAAFNDWQVSQEEFLELYPLNPLAINLLDNLKPLFSQHRGIIDFIHYRLKGDQSRNIEGMLDEPAKRLLNPDLIFDHFLDRIRENTETRDYYEKVYRYYQQEISSILSGDETETGLKLIKLLILFAISPVEKDYTVREISHMVLEPLTELETEANYEYIADLLQRLDQHGAYLALKEDADERIENVYYLNLKADVNLIIQKKVDYIRSNFFEEEERLFSSVGHLVNEEYLPLADLLEKPRTVRQIKWQQTERRGYLCLLNFNTITLRAIREFNERLKYPDPDEGFKAFKDFVIFMAYPLQLDKQQKYLSELIIPELDSGERAAFAFWLPEELENKGLLREVLARQLLLEEYQDKKGETAVAVNRKLQQLINEDGKNVVDIFRKAYFAGSIVNGRGEKVLEPEKTGILTFKKLISRIADALLELRFPEHFKISPYNSSISDRQIDELCREFLESGQLEKTPAAARGLLPVIENCLKPLGILKTKGKTLSLNVNPAGNPLLKTFFSLMEEERTPLNDIYLKLRKGNYGLSRKQFKIMVMALLYSGYITAYSEKKKIALSRLNPYNFERIKYLGYGELIDSSFQKVLQDCSLLPARFKNQPFSLPLQQEIWNHIVEKKREMAEDIRNLKVKITDLTLDEELKATSQEELLNNLQQIGQLLEEIKVSYSAEDGLERFAVAYQSQPNADNYLKRYQKLNSFFEDKYNIFLEIKNYLENLPELPDEGRFASLKKTKGEIGWALEDRAVIFEDQYLEGLQERFYSFRRSYAKEYFEEHQRKLSGGRFSSYHQIEESEEYRALTLLSEIEMISVK